MEYELLTATQQLIDRNEIQILCFGLCVLTLVLAGIVGGIIMLHSTHKIMGSSRLYRHRKPVDGWDKTFYPVAILLIIGIFVVSWFLYQLSLGIIPFV
jgi:hypothetical protein